jgi:septum formation protein
MSDRPLTPFIDWPAAETLVLASRSPRRAELLAVAGVPFEVVLPGEAAEAVAARDLDAKGDPALYAETLAAAKARDVAATLPGRLVLGADTVVVLDGEVLEKPLDEADAVRLLTLLSGRRHTVISAVALCGGAAGDAGCVAHESTAVEFLSLSHGAIARYVATGEPMDKAGAYGIQGYGALMVRGVEGCYFNVMGLPLARLGEMLRTVLADGGHPA